MTVPVSPIAVTPAWLAAELVTGRVLSAAKAAQALAEFEADSNASQTADEFAEFLTEAGTITPFQADRAKVGQARTLPVGPYLLLEPMGTRLLGPVYQAVHRGDRRRFAVQVLPLRSVWHTLQARNQVSAMADLPPHPAVVSLADVGTADGVHYLAWPFAEGEPLDDLVQRVGPLSPAQAARLLSDVADGLAGCHAHGIAHGLITPTELLFGTDRRLKLVGLGTGAILSESLAGGESMLGTGSMIGLSVGTLDYTAPEAATDPTVRTPAADVYSLGCVLYFLLTGSAPFPDGTAVDKILAHSGRSPVPVRDRNPLVPAGLAELVGRLMAKSPADRPADMAAVRDALRSAEAAAGSPPVAIRSAVDTPAPVPVPAAIAPAEAVWETPAPRDVVAGAVSFDLPAVPAGDDRPAQQESLLPPITFTPPTSPSAEPDRPLPSPADTPRGRWANLAREFGRLIPGALRTARDDVQVSVFGPREAGPGRMIRGRVYAHPKAAFAGVCALARAMEPNSELLGTGGLAEPVARGAEVRLHLSVANAAVGRSVVRFVWKGRQKSLPFELHVPWESPAGRTSAALTVGLGGVEVARVPFHLTVLPRTTR